MSLGIYSKAVIATGARCQLKRTKSFAKSSLEDLVYKPGNLFQGDCES